MSIHIMNQVWRHSKAKSGSLLVLLAIADHADDEGQAYPSIPGIALKSRLKMRQVHNAVQALITLGELSVEYKAGPKGKNLYTVHVSESKDCTMQNLHSAPECRVDPAMDCTVQPIAPKSSYKSFTTNRQLKPSFPPLSPKGETGTEGWTKTWKPSKRFPADFPQAPPSWFLDHFHDSPIDIAHEWSYMLDYTYKSPRTQFYMVARKWIENAEAKAGVRKSHSPKSPARARCRIDGCPNEPLGQFCEYHGG